MIGWRQRVEVAVHVALQPSLGCEALATPGDDALVGLVAAVVDDVPLQPRYGTRRPVEHLASRPQTHERLAAGLRVHVTLSYMVHKYTRIQRFITIFPLTGNGLLGLWGFADATAATAAIAAAAVAADAAAAVVGRCILVAMGTEDTRDWHRCTRA